jgi:hypothetical protein
MSLEILESVNIWAPSSLYVLQFTQGEAQYSQERICRKEVEYNAPVLLFNKVRTVQG